MRNLKEKSKIEALFKKGKNIFIKNLPIFIIVHKNAKYESYRVNKYLFSVPKKNISKAVNRNKIKRRLKEACRGLLKKQRLINNYLCIGIIYRSKSISSYNTILNSLNKLFKIIDSHFK